jgi:ketosteroid isomerase-like protein
VHRVLADDAHVVVEHAGRNETPDGRQYNNNYCWVMRFDNGLIREIREYMDTQLVMDTFGAADQS